MLCNPVKGFKNPCGANPGGIGLIWVFDSADFDFTTGAPVNGEDVGYSTVERHAGATSVGGAYFYPIDTVYETTGLQITQANADGVSNSYAYAMTARLGGISQSLTNFLKRQDSAATCCQLGYIFFLNSGKVIVAGEKYVDDMLIPPFRLRQDGTVLNTGKTFTEFNGADFSIKGNYLRAPYEFIGGISVIQALQAP